MHVLVGLSGGVDSSVAAHLLIEAGHDVVGVHMQNWHAERDDPHCRADQDLSDAQKVCEQLNIPLRVVDFSKEYQDRVFQSFLDEYAKGRTPNPDVMCNQEIKFKAFLEYALEQKADKIATGHYAQILHQEQSDTYHLLKGLDATKDQSYFLYRLNQRQLSKTMFPLGHLEKKAVRAIATQLGLVTCDKKDSTGLCFIGERNFKDFLSEYLLPKPGPICTESGDVIGQHDGLMYYTLGQRKGLNIGGVKHYTEEPWYVAQRQMDTNTLVVVQGDQHPALYGQRMLLTDMTWVCEDAPADLPYACFAKVRYRQKEKACTLSQLENGQWQLDFDRPQFAPAPGQSAALYQGDECLGGGIILELEAYKPHSAPKAQI